MIRDLGHLVDEAPRGVRGSSAECEGATSQGGGWGSGLFISSMNIYFLKTADCRALSKSQNCRVRCRTTTHNQHSTQHTSHSAAVYPYTPQHAHTLSLFSRSRFQKAPRVTRFASLSLSLSLSLLCKTRRPSTGSDDGHFAAERFPGDCAVSAGDKVGSGRGHRDVGHLHSSGRHLEDAHPAVVLRRR